MTTGPDSALIERFLERLQELEFEQLTRVVASWREALRRSDNWYAAEDAVGDAIARLHRHDDQWRLQGRVYDHLRRTTWYHDAHPASSVSGTEAAAQYLASTAAFALLVADRLTRAQLATLYAPFVSVIPPASIGLDIASPTAGQPSSRPAEPPGAP